ncbi:HAMP domain-containing sensor histidine kinase [Actinocorallia sp. A-T 12471]|uniref:sensor histidine kinase n=1 Tax=Actinocorallia sp. A-T 12471 TaxID=3089813 RepID=UPI0029CC3716|nr:HAMP domain-containing sensor histidine kinase [Actinocorallia sp. A-T 12471]MDX6739696.1 HAMP domain-containing sensor histidine kinase [Actinocorallia sp. A-T 12471]
MSAHTRIVAWVLLVVALALTVAGSATWSLLVGRLDARVGAELANEAEKLRAFAKRAGPATDVRGLLRDYLGTMTPDTYETYFSVVNGKVDQYSVVRSDERLHLNKELVAAASAAQEPSTGWASSDAGQVRYLVMPVRVTGDDRKAAFVVGVFYDEQRREVTDVMRSFALTSALAVAVAGAAGWLVAGRVLAPVRLVRKTAERISDSADLTRRLDVPGDDDISALAGTFNRMLDRLERAFAIQREFLDDAGHELRTPLTVVRGHLELMGEEDREETVALVLDELERMNRIVDDLLLLARSEQPGFLDVGEVAVAELTVDVLAKVRTLADRTWRLDEVADTHVLADGQRLTQALVQFVANAVRHTRDGGRISVGSALRGQRLELWVRDDGPGVPADQRARIFERFVHGAQTGTGLGLAIVANIAAAHGGRAEVRDAPEGGAVFLISIPAYRTGEPGEPHSDR